MLRSRKNMRWSVKMVVDRICINLAVLSGGALVLFDLLVTSGAWWTAALYFLFLIVPIGYKLSLFLPARDEDIQWLKRELEDQPHWIVWIDPYKVESYIPVWLVKELRKKFSILVRKRGD